MRERILHVIGNLGLGGAQSVLYHLWPSLCRSERYAFEICVLNSLGHFGERLISEGATVHCLESKYKYDPVAILDLRRIIQNDSYRIVHAHLFPELFIVPLAAARLRHVSLVYTEHLSSNRRRGYPFPFRWLDRLAYRKYLRIIAVNQSTRDNLVRWQPELANRIVVIPNSVRIGFTLESGVKQRKRMSQELELPAQGHATLLLFAGRLTREKGVDILLKALAKLRDVNYVCLIAGDGPDREQLQRMAQDLYLNERVCFLGTRSDLLQLLRAVDMMVLPSRWEGLPLIVLESMAASCPIVATAVDGTADVLRNEVSALLVPPEEPQALAKAISRLSQDISLRDKLAAQALEDVKAYSAQKGAERLLAVYDAILSARR